MCVCEISRFGVKLDQFLKLVSILLVSGGDYFNHIKHAHAIYREFSVEKL